MKWLNSMISTSRMMCVKIFIDWVDFLMLLCLFVNNAAYLIFEYLILDYT